MNSRYLILCCASLLSFHALSTTHEQSSETLSGDVASTADHSEAPPAFAEVEKAESSQQPAKPVANLPSSFAEEENISPERKEVEVSVIPNNLSTVKTNSTDSPHTHDMMEESAIPSSNTTQVEPSSVALMPEEGDCGQLRQQNELELDKLQNYVTAANKRLEKLSKELNQGEQKRRQQAVLIDFFEQELLALRKRYPKQNEILSQVFTELVKHLPESPVFRVENNRLIIMTDFILVFGRGEVSTEGETRLQLIANAMREAEAAIPDDINWRWRIEGHSDSQPLRSITWFPSNWELSAARASGIARYLIDQGIPANRIRVAALGVTKPIAPNAGDEDEHWRNRRVEIQWVFEQD